MAATKCIKACGRGQEVHLFFTPNVRMRNKCDLRDFDRGLFVGGRLLISLDFHKQRSLEFAENGAKNKKHPVSSSSADRNALLMREV